MTPSALTPAARGSRDRSNPASGRRAAGPAGAGHRSAVRRQTSPRGVRRWSGPLAGLTRKAQSQTEQPSRTRTRQTARQSVARPASVTTATRPVGASWNARVAAYMRALPDHALLDRLIRGRLWIPLLGVLLAGIVAMQVEVLKLNAGIGRSLQRGAALQSQNQLLRASVSQLTDARRIERLAAAMGMVMPAPTQVRFLAAGTVATERALSSIHAPSGATYSAAIHAAAAAAAAADPSLNATSTAATATGASIGSATQTTPGVSPQGASTTGGSAATSPAVPAAATAATPPAASAAVPSGASAAVPAAASAATSTGG